MQTFPDFTKKIRIQAPVSRVWEVLTVPDLMEKWLMDDQVQVQTDWTVGSAILIKVLEHWVLSESKGTVLQFEENKILRYSHLSSLSRLADEIKNHSVLEFRLQEAEDATLLDFTASNFPTESIYKHLVFYWNTTLDVIRRLAEEGK